MITEARYQKSAAAVTAAMRGRGEMYAVNIAVAMDVEPTDLRPILVEMERRGELGSRVEGSGPKRRRWYWLLKEGS